MKDCVADFTVSLKTRPPAAAGVVEGVQDVLGVVFPEDYRRLMTVSNGIEGNFGKRYLALFALEQLPELNRAAQVKQWAPGFVLFGSDLGGVSYLFDTHPGAQRFIQVHDEEMSMEDATHCGKTLADFLQYVYSTDY